MQNADSSPIIIAMDIDDFLTSMQIKELREKGWLDPVHHCKDHFFTVEFEHNEQHYKVENVVTPGCIEFLRFLFEQKFVRPAFFSAGIRTRNLDPAKKVVQMAIADGGDPEWINRYDVYSREDCFDSDQLHHFMDREVYDKFQPKHFFGNYKKDLRMIHYGRETYQNLYEQALKDPNVLLPNSEKDQKILENLVLVEEDSSYLFPGQEKNMLLCPTYRHHYPYTINYQGEETPYDPNDFSDKFKSSNTIFYAAGVLDSTFERHSLEGLSMPEILWQEQGFLWTDHDCYKEHYPLHFFTRGREVLRKYNPKLNFAVASSEAGF